MIVHGKQVGKWALIAFFFLVFSSGWIQAATIPSATKAEKKALGASGAGGSKPFSLGGLLDDVLPSFSSQEEEEVDKKEEADSSSKDEKETKEKKADSEPDTIKAKRTSPVTSEEKSAKSQEEKKDAPYKVYSSSFVPEEPSVEVFEPAPKKAAMEEPALEPEEPPVVDKDAPPPLPEILSKVSRNLQPLPPAASALPQQFFPLLPLGEGKKAQVQLLPIASSVDLAQDQSLVTRAVIVMHDIARNASESLATLMTLAGADSVETLILAPQFPLAMDITRFAAHLPDSGANVARWPIEMGWQSGAESKLSVTEKGISSFTAMDYLLMFLGDRERFPSLQQIVIVGHGMGGDFVQRYAAAGKGPELLGKDGLPIRFVVANPSTYLYMTAVRPVQDGGRFDHVDKQKCAGVNDYPYGLENLVPYARQAGANAIRLHYPERKMIYLVGESFVVDHYLDRDCPAMAQGKDRTARGKNFARYLAQSFGPSLQGNQIFSFVPNVGYNVADMFGSACGVEAIFGEGRCASSKR